MFPRVPGPVEPAVHHEPGSYDSDRGYPYLTAPSGTLRHRLAPPANVLQHGLGY